MLAVSGLSPGLAQGCFELLELITKHRLTFSQIKASFANLGGLPSSKVVDAAQALNWLQADDEGSAALTPWGARLLGLIGYEAQLRQALLDYIDIERPSWIQNASFGRRRVLSFAGNQIAQVFVEAGLVDGTSDEVVFFWDALAARSRGQKSQQLNDIGRRGEKLTIAYEHERTGKKPKWISIDNNADGYDVLSIVNIDDPRKLTIEVKTSTIGNSGRFFVTRNEWERAIYSDCHIFHLWDVSKPEIPRLAVISVDIMNEHVPIDQGLGVWDVVEVPFSNFETLFACP